MKHLLFAFLIPLTLLMLLHQSNLYGYNNNSSDLVSLAGLPPKEIPIKHIIVIMQGKHTFDNYFGTFPGADGFPSNLTVPFNPFPPPLSKFTVAAWFITNSTFQTDGFIVNKGGFGTDKNGHNMNYGIWMNNSGNIMAGFETNDGTDHVIGSKQEYNDGKWHQAVVNYDGHSKLALFIDGNQIAINQTGGASPEINSVAPIRVGANSFQPENFFEGYIDEVRIWNRTLEHSEILNGYYNNSYNPDKPIIYSSFEDRENYLGNPSVQKGGLKLSGIFLNGTTYQDLKLDPSKYTNYLKPFHLGNTGRYNPKDSPSIYALSYNNGSMNGFVSAQRDKFSIGKNVMGYYDDSDIPYYWKFASEYALAQRFFSPSMRSDVVNSLFAIGADPPLNLENIPKNGLYINRTIFDELEANGIPWKVYIEKVENIANLSTQETKRLLRNIPILAIARFNENETLAPHIADLAQFYEDLNSNKFPAVSYLYFTNSSDTSQSRVREAQEFVATLVYSLMKSPYWNSSAVIITHNGAGGWYDHVKPPFNNNTNELNGFRVPTTIISPYVGKGYIDSSTYDIASVLKFIGTTFDIKNSSYVDNNITNNLNQAFSFSDPPRKPIYLEEITQERTIVNSNDVIGVNALYVLGLILPIAITLVWFCRKKVIKNEKNL
jgi:phospholipase C